MDPGTHPMAELIIAATQEDYLEARALLREYGASIAGTVCAEGFEEECNTVDSTYEPPTGRFLLLCIGSNGAGCVGLRTCASGVIEMKRLYVRPAYRGRGLGRRLVEAAGAMAREMGGRILRLHTLPAMVTARHLYRSMGFVSMASTGNNACRGDVPMELRLTRPTLNADENHVAVPVRQG